MKAILLVAVVLAAPASRQEPEKKGAADLDKHAREQLQKEVSVLQDLTLPMFFFMLDTNEEADLEYYVDPVAIPKLDDVKTTFTGEGTLDEILEKTLKEKSLLHHVWQGIVFITDEKGRKALQDLDWTGLTKKSLEKHAELSKKLETAFAFKWDAYEPREALKEIAKQSGIAIQADALANMKVKREKRGLLSPRRTTPLGALWCLARTTGVTYEVSQSGGLVAKPPRK